jgi:hypothetical protein
VKLSIAIGVHVDAAGEQDCSLAIAAVSPSIAVTKQGVFASLDVLL